MYMLNQIGVFCIIQHNCFNESSNPTRMTVRMRLIQIMMRGNNYTPFEIVEPHHNDAIMSTMASQITDVSIVCWTAGSGTNKKKTSKLRVIGLCAGISPVNGEFPAQKASNTENVSI